MNNKITTKTVLFASLIPVMVMSLCGVNYAYAEKEIVLINDTFDNGTLDGWTHDYKWRGYLSNPYDNYVVSNDNGTMHIDGDAGGMISGLVKTVTLPADIVNATISFDSKAYGTLPSHPDIPNSLFALWGENKTIIHQEFAIRNVNTAMSSWKSFSIDIASYLVDRNEITIFLGVYDAWVADWNQEAWFDNVKLSVKTNSTTTTPSYTKPSPPTNLSATPGDSQVSLSWNAPADDGGQSIVSYIIEHKIAGAQGQWFKTYVSGTMTNGTVTGLDNGKPYYFRVVAANGAFDSPASDIVTSVPNPNGLVITKPSTPTNLSATPGDSQVSLSWNAPADDGGQSIVSYIIEHKIAGAQGQWFKTYVSGTMTNGTVTGLDNGKPYYFRVVAANGAFDSPASDIVTSVPNPNGLVITKPSTPTNLSATPGDSQVSLSWNAPADDGGQSIVSYIIEHKIAGAQGQWFKTYVSGTMTNGTVTGLDNGKPYYFRVTATNGAFSSVPSGILTDTPQ